MDLARRPAPFRIETERLVLRCPELTDVDLVQEAVSESIESLRPWMPWVEGEPVAREQRLVDVERFRENFERHEDYIYFLFTPTEDRMLGGMGLHPRVGPKGLELGYWIRSSERGRGLAVEGAAALIRAAFDCVGVDRVEIRIEPENAASQRIVEKLDVPKEATLRRRLPREDELRDVDVFTIFAADLADSTISHMQVRFLDAQGQPVAV
jgi:RimJ/RimL family protein N-acetyltransferase